MVRIETKKRSSLKKYYAVGLVISVNKNSIHLINQGEIIIMSRVHVEEGSL
jgi:hypothetical protein